MTEKKRTSRRGLVIAERREDTPPRRVPVALIRRRFGQSQQRLDITVKLAFRYGADDDAVVAELAEEPVPLCVDTPSPLEGASDDELWMASDFRSLKAEGEIVVVGHAKSVKPSKAIAAGFAVGDIERAFSVVSEEPVTRAPIVKAALRDELGDEGEPPVGPQATPSDVENALAVGLPQSPRSQRGPHFSPSETIELDGLDEAQPSLAVSLPGVQPVMRALMRGGGGESVPLVFDTLWIDVDSRTIVACWRGIYEARRRFAREVACMSLHLKPAVEEGEEAPPPGNLARSHFSYALEEGDLELPEPRYSEDRLRMARYSVMASQQEPTLPLETYALVAAELAEELEPRDEVLERHGWDPDAWLVEERAWMEHIADRSIERDHEPAEKLAVLFVAAQDALATEEERLELEPFAELWVAIEQAENPAKVLEERKRRLASWMREQRRWQKLALDDASVKIELDAAIDAARAAHEGAATS